MYLNSDRSNLLQIFDHEVHNTHEPDLCFNFQKDIDDDIFSSVVRVDDGGLTDVSYSNGGSGGGLAVTMTCEKLPEPTEFGDGNPFLMFLCLVRYSAVIIRH